MSGHVYEGEIVGDDPRVREVFLDVDLALRPHASPEQRWKALKGLEHLIELVQADPIIALAIKLDREAKRGEQPTGKSGDGSLQDELKDALRDGIRQVRGVGLASILEAIRRPPGANGAGGG